MDRFVKVASLGDLSDGEMMLVDVGGDGIVIASLEGGYYAFDNECTHSYCSLSEGELNGEIIRCPCHGAEFDIRTGDVVNPPAVEPLQVYSVTIEENDILIGSSGD